MFSAMKKLRSGGVNPSSPQTPSGPINKSEEPHPMSVSLQKKFSKGIDYNMKLLLRGDRMSGKSSLFLRLQGFPFPKDPNYTATEEISVASIQWSYKATDDIVKVEVWDVVDRGKKRPALQGLKLSSNDVPPPQPALDAEFVDVYKGANGVVLLFDMTKSWTFDYVKRELPKIPTHLPVLILANFADQCHHRAVTKEQALGFIEEMIADMPSRDKNTIRYAESSMRNGFGLKFLHKFLNLPFLLLQRNSLLTQLKTNDRDIVATHQELDLLTESEESSYESFSDNVTKMRRQVAESQGPPPTVDVVLGAQKTVKEDNPIMSMNLAPPTPAPPSEPSNTPSSSSKSSPSRAPESKPALVQNVKNVDDFVPDSSGIDNFLMDEDSSQKTNSNRALDDGESSDDDGVNHLVAGFNEEVVIDDYDTGVAIADNIANNGSSSEDEFPKVAAVSTSTPPLSSTQLKNALPSRDIAAPDGEDDTDEAFHSKPTKEKHHKKKKKSKSSRKKSEEEERNALEEFLNGIPDETVHTSNAYEEF